MSSTQTIFLTLPDSATTFQSITNLGSGKHPGLVGIINYLRGILGGQRAGALTVYNGSVAGTAVLTVSSTGSSNNDTGVVCGVTFTAKTSGATGNQFNISSTPATQAANMVAAFNASPNLAGIVTASNVLGVITLTAAVPGAAGNALVVTSSWTNVAVTTSFATSATGANGTIYTLDFS